MKFNSLNHHLTRLSLLGWIILVGLSPSWAQQVRPTPDSTGVEGQELRLSREYVKVGEFEKAKSVLQKFVRGRTVAPEIHAVYLNALTQLKQWDEAEKYLKRLLRSSDDPTAYQAELGQVYMRAGKNNEAEKQWESAIDQARTREGSTRTLGELFGKANQTDWAMKLYQSARDYQKAPGRYALELAQLYRSTGQLERMVGEYLAYGKQPEHRSEIEALLQDELRDEKTIEVLERELYRKVQEQPNEPYYNELLIWHLIQLKEFNKAFIQARAMDRRNRQEGQKVVEIGFMAMQNKDYAAAGKAFEYAVKEYPRSPSYPVYRRMMISAKEELVKTTYPVNTQEIRSLIAEYRRLVDELGRNAKTLEAMRSTAQLYAFYLNEKDTAQAILQSAIQSGGNEREFIDRCKLDLGDVYLLKNEPWEATLLYSQVEKSQKETPLGYEAKLRNAKLNYYRGDFELAKEMLDILKMATTREIANDAMQVSLLIQDNTGLDSTETAMKAYAAVELLLFQNQTGTALAALDSLFRTYQEHSLADEILWLRANTLIKENRAQEAVGDLEKIRQKHGEDVLGDDALFALAKVYQEKLNDKETAMRLFQQVLTQYPGSIYVAEARKRFRNLRGDAIN
jgi:tetratricopeptide (TPR) repeat protein